MRSPVPRLIFVSLLAGLVSVVFAACAMAEMEMQFVGRFGPEVNATKTEEAHEHGNPNHITVEDENTCTELSGDTCKPGNNSNSGSGGEFTYPTGLALDQTTGDVYVTDKGHNRVNEYSATGEFILAFGSKVNGSNGGDICHKGEPCLIGQDGAGAAAFGGLVFSIAVDQETGDVYVGDILNDRVMEYTGQGEFILTFGGHVNKTQTEAHAGAAMEDVCTAVSGDVCQAGTEGGGTGGFAGWPSGDTGNTASFIAAGGPTGKERIYVGDRERVQEFTAAGEPVGSINVAALGAGYSVYSLAVDAQGNVYVIAGTGFGYPSTSVHVYNASGEEQALQFDPGQTTARSVAVTANGQVILIESDPSCGVSCGIPHHGEIYEPDGTLLLPSFGGGDFTWGSPEAAPGVAYDDVTKRLYTVEERGGPHDELDDQVLVFKGYLPFPTTGGVSVAEPNVGVWRFTGSVSAFELEVNGLSVEYGSCGQAPANVTESVLREECVGKGFGDRVTGCVVGSRPCETKIPVGQSSEVEAVTEGLEANSAYHARGDASNANGDGRSKQPVFFTTSPRPAVARTSGVEDVLARTGRLTGVVNPQNAASKYRFEYGACVPLSACGQDVAYTTQVSVGEGGKDVRVSRVVSGLYPATTYSYRILTYNSFGQGGQSTESTFTTSPSSPPGVSTGVATGVSLNNATITGAVEPDGIQTGYRFELGVDEGPHTLWAVAAAGSAGEGGAPVAVSVVLSGLQPATTYAYRLVAVNDEGETTGVQATFTTLAPPVFTLPPAPALLPESFSASPVASVASAARIVVTKAKTKPHTQPHKTHKHHKTHGKARRRARGGTTATGAKHRRRGV